MQSGQEAGNMCLALPAPTHAVVAVRTEAAFPRQQMQQCSLASQRDAMVTRKSVTLLDIVAHPMHHDTVPMSQTP